tara:strand:- start:17457 stop:17696 length:240 start_codon:yes stop_codon:yes gene_type:complete
MGPIVVVSLFVLLGLGVFIAISKNDLGVTTFKNNEIKPIDNQKDIKVEEDQVKSSLENNPDINLQSTISSEAENQEPNS